MLITWRTKNESFEWHEHISKVWTLISEFLLISLFKMPFYTTFKKKKQASRKTWSEWGLSNANSGTVEVVGTSRLHV